MMEALFRECGTEAWIPLSQLPLADLKVIASGDYDELPGVPAYCNKAAVSAIAQRLLKERMP